MAVLLTYIRDYFRWLNKRVFIASALFMALSIFSNYYFGINSAIGSMPEGDQMVCWYFVFFIHFCLPYLMQAIWEPWKLPASYSFLLLFIIAPAIFAWKMAADVQFFFSAHENVNQYWNSVVYWPYKLVVVTAVLFVVWLLFHRKQPFYGWQTKDLHTRTYFMMLLLMVPLIAAASTQPDFLDMYPRLQRVQELFDNSKGWQKLLYELSYGSDFFTIELFFRGFLVLAFAKWVGRSAILPMALFYCSIHFGKPVGECISSFFGGLILGVVIYHTRSFFGGLIVHLGIAWMMELGGYLGNLASP